MSDRLRSIHDLAAEHLAIRHQQAVNGLPLSDVSQDIAALIRDAHARIPWTPEDVYGLERAS